jgi:glycosyltransferase involved in cell wall biosynthesis
MRIWILNHYAIPQDQPGGTRHYDISRVLAAKGHDVTIFASSFSHFTFRDERLQKNERMRVDYIDGIRFVWIRTTPYSGNDARRVLNMLSYGLGVIRAQRHIPRPDVIVGSSPHPLAVAAAWLIASIRRLPFIFEVRDLWPQLLVDVGALKKNSIATRLFREAERFLYRHARVIIALSPKDADYITLLGIPKEKIIYIPNGIADYDERVPRMSDNAVKFITKVTEMRQAGHLVAGYVGSLVRAQGVDVFVEAARVLHDRGISNVAFVFVGDGPEKGKCQQLARRHDLRDVLFWDPLPKRDVPSIISTFDVALYSLRDIAVFKYGLSSNKLFDYLASGCPIISSCATVDTPVSASGGGICVPPESPEEIADALVRLDSMSTAERHAMGERGRQWVYQYHGVTASAELFLDALVQAQR